MLVLGIADHVNCGSALVQDGQVVSALNDERLVREKMVFGVPRESIRRQLAFCGIEAGQIDRVAIATERQHLVPHYVDFREGWFGLERGRFKQLLFDVASRVSPYRRKLPWLDRLYYAARSTAYARRRRAWRSILSDELGIDAPIEFIDHHFCHVASAYYTSGFEDATLFSIDGGGDGKSGSVYTARSGEFECLAEISSFDSLGNFYSYVTQLCGFKAGRHEGKITGLAAYGKPIYLGELDAILDFHEGGFRNRGSVFYEAALRELERVLPDDFLHADLAASVQQHAEDLTVKQVQYWVQRTGLRKVALAGGVVANVKINQRVHELPEVDEIFIHPGMSDEGLPVGAALASTHRHSGEEYDAKRVAMPHVYLGPEFGDEEIQAALAAAGVEATRHDEVEREIARLLADDQVVARFDGRMEYGPRALGHRTILYGAGDPTVNVWLNEALSRTEFMPFAPVVLAERAPELFRNLEGAENAARFMTITFDCTPWMAERCPGVVHVDNTARPQLVSERDDPGMHRILAEYEALTGVPVLINTSFNLHEEPIVCTPEEAVRAFQDGHLDYLAIGQWIAENPSPQPRNADATRFERALQRRGVVRKKR